LKTTKSPHANPESLNSKQGLTIASAVERLKIEGFNELPVPHRRNFFRLIVDVLRQPMFALLIGGGFIYLMLGDLVEALVLLLFACLSIAITVIQESRSENVLAALRNLASPRALVIRDGQPMVIAGREIVREDLIVVSEGDRVAADAKLISSQDLLLDESLLTGESIPVNKLASNEKSTSTPVPDVERSSDIFAGTLVSRGSGQAMVYATGINTEMGKIGRVLSTIQTEQPHLQKQIKSFVKVFAIIGGFVGTLVIILLGFFRGSWLEAMLGGIALGMSLLPEEFPLVLAVFMAMGAWRISRARVLTRQASAIETLGATTVLCSDKTGTLTENNMTVVAIVFESEQWYQNLNAALSDETIKVLKVALLACQQELTDAMDIAIHQLVKKVPSLAAISFESNRLLHAYGLRTNMLAVANIRLDDNGNKFAFAKGAVEAIAKLCVLSDSHLASVSAQVGALAHDGIRVLAVAKAAIHSDNYPDSISELKFEYIGLIGFADPLRSNVPTAVAECRSAGIRVLMITGDYSATAQAIGLQAGLDITNVLSGSEIEAMSDEALALHIKSTSIFARIQPNQKLRIVESLKSSGEIVAMTGDGVNDAPAIKAAHIGIAMGRRGTDVAREASAIVLLDDDFNSIVKTISLGRRIYDNLRKAIQYIVAVHIPIAGLALLPLLLGMPLILTPIHIAFLEMVIDPACSIVFEAERAESDVMKKQPRNQLSPLLLPRQIIWSVIQGLITLAILSAVLIYEANVGMPEDKLRALIFTSLVLMNICLILMNRSFNPSLIEAFIKPNKSLWILVGSVITLLIVTLLWQPARLLFHFGPLDLGDIAVCFTSSLIGLSLLQLLKSKWFGADSVSSKVVT
jgi:Ca2+-transporting ATPase